MSKFFKICGVLWASPASLFGIVVGLAALPFGGRARYRAGCIEFFGPPFRWIFQNLAGLSSVSAMTLGHVIWGTSQPVLDQVSDHERVHVRQYERWGPFFVPAYLLASGYLWLCGRHPYWDNPFEREAYGKTGTA